jgi:hypothetical protein
MFDRLIAWITVEPTVSLLMVAAAVVLFSAALVKNHDSAPSFWHWLRRIIEASIGALLFIGVLWAFRSILNTNNNTYYSTHGSLNSASLESAYTIWGRPHVQRELGYAHYTEVTRQEEIPRANPNDPPMYRDVTEQQFVPQNSVRRFRGTVDLTLSEHEKGYALYNGYLIDARFVYDIVNDSRYETQATFDFPLSPGQTLYENFSIMVDGEDISQDLRFSSDLVQWTTAFHPLQPHQIIISYHSRGMETFYFQIPSQRQIKDFVLTVGVDRLPVSLLNYPDGTLTPTRVEPTADGLGSVLTWEFDNAITVAGMGVALPQPVQPGAEVLRVLSNSRYALTLLGAMLALTLLLCGQPVQFLDLALLAGAYSIEFLLMAAVSDSVFGFWGSLVIGALAVNVLTYLLYRKYPPLPSRLIFGLVGFFSILYPLSGLITDVGVQNSFNNLVQVGLIVYLFCLALTTRLKNQPQQTIAVTA